MKKLAILVGGTTQEQPGTMRAGRHIQEAIGLLWNCSIFELDEIDSIQSVIKAGANSAIIVDSIFAHSDITLSLKLRHSLAEAGVTIIGASSEAFSIARDKFKSKQLFSEAGVASPRTFYFGDLAQIRKHELVFPLIAKPNFGASSIGVNVLDQASDIENLQKTNPQIEDWLIEEFVPGREFTVAVVATPNEVIVLPPAEIEMTDSRFYDYRTKNETLSNNLYLPARLTKCQAKELEGVARSVISHFPPMALSRIDIILCDNRWHVIEINSEPLLSNDDFVARCARAYGWSYEKLLTTLLPSI